MNAETESRAVPLVMQFGLELDVLNEFTELNLIKNSDSYVMENHGAMIQIAIAVPIFYPNVNLTSRRLLGLQERTRPFNQAKAAKQDLLVEEVA